MTDPNDSSASSEQDWSGESAPSHRRFTASPLWSGTAFYVRFDAHQHEPLVVGPSPDITKKTNRLWERDVCEIFIAPDSTRRNRYFEFEIAPTGEWIDLGIVVDPEQRLTNLDYISSMESAARIETDRVVMAMKIPFASLGGVPKPGDTWLGNVFRCIGSGADRGYLAWRPTRTRMPSFHVPEAFGEFTFRG